MLQDKFVPPAGAFTRSVPVRFSHCDPAGIVYFPHYFDIFNGLIDASFVGPVAGFTGSLAVVMPANTTFASIEKQTYYGGLYQKLVLTR